MDASLGGRISDDTDSLTRAFASSRVGLGALSADGETAKMTNAAITFNALQALQVHADLAAQVTFNDIFSILNGMDNLGELLLGKILGTDARSDIGASENLISVGRTNAVDITQGNFDAFVRRNFYSNDTSHKYRLTLPLFVTGICANHTNDAFATDNFALFTKFLN